MHKKGPISTVFSDCVVTPPSPKESDGGSFGDPLPGGPTRVTGELGEVQFSKIQGAPGEGKVSPGKLSGGGSY
jgi:hypothetical protein